MLPAQSTPCCCSLLVYTTPVVQLSVKGPYLLFHSPRHHSIPLTKALHERSTDFIGTCYQNLIGLPSNIQLKSFLLHDDEVQAQQAGNFLLVGWRAAKKKQAVVILSMKCYAATTEVRSHTTGETTKKPLVAHNYNFSMNRVEKAEQFNHVLLSHCSLSHSRQF